MEISPITADSKIMQKICSFIPEHFLVEFDSEFNNETDLFDAGIIDSFGFIELVTFLEKNFDVKLTDEELRSDGLNSVSKMTTTILNKQSAC